MQKDETTRKPEESSFYTFCKSHNLLLLFLIGSMIGAAVFIYIYGTKILNPTYDDWLMSGEDLTQHYLGWVFFRKSGFNFPFGLTEGLLYPDKISVIFTDSIPLFAFIFKLLSPLLPETFQYFGLWGILCYMLQGGLGTVLVKKFTDSNIIPVLSSVIFAFSPIVIYRLY